MTIDFYFLFFSANLDDMFCDMGVAALASFQTQAPLNSGDSHFFIFTSFLKILFFFLFRFLTCI